MSTMGVPCDVMSASIRLRIWRPRSASTPASRVSPSCMRACKGWPACVGSERGTWGRQPAHGSIHTPDDASGGEWQPRALCILQSCKRQGQNYSIS